MIEVRLHIDPSQTQRLTSIVLAIHGLIALFAAPIIAHFTDKTPSRKIPLLLSLAGCFAGTLLLASSSSCMRPPPLPSSSTAGHLFPANMPQYGFFLSVVLFKESLSLQDGLWDCPP